MAIKTERERERESPRNEIVKLYNITGLTCKKKYNSTDQYKTNQNTHTIVTVSLALLTKCHKQIYSSEYLQILQYIQHKKLVPWGTDGRLPLSGDFRSLIVV